ncbi:MAG: DinB family protein, partial [bacterium]|nr:DinB family protein [bacterium]
MTWTAPQVTRSPAPRTGDEWTMLTGFLDWQRVTLLSKCAGMTGEQLAERSAPPSALSLLGIVRHLSEVER